MSDLMYSYYTITSYQPVYPVTQLLIIVQHTSYALYPYLVLFLNNINRWQMAVGKNISLNWA